MSYIVMDAWNVVVARFADYADAQRCARAKGGFVVTSNVRIARYV